MMADSLQLINSNERPKENPNAEKVWKSSGYYVAHWVPLIKNSMDVKQWRLKNYTAYVLETSEDVTLDHLNS